MFCSATPISPTLYGKKYCGSCKAKHSGDRQRLPPFFKQCLTNLPLPDLYQRTVIFSFSFSSVAMAKKDPCQKYACEIQKCLQANKYIESKCEAVFQEMRRCCARYPKGISVVCSGFESEAKEKTNQMSTSAAFCTPQPSLRKHSCLGERLHFLQTI
ncbi:cx9C motif-containing protein 4 isoform X1 [Pogona vitticeps]